MRILYLTQRPPYPPNKGQKIRAFHQIQYLSKVGHELHLVSASDEPEGADGDSALSELCAQVEIFSLNRSAKVLRSVTGLLGSAPLSTRLFHSKRLLHHVNQLAREGHFDLVLASSSSMAQYARPFSSTPRVLDLIDVDSAKWRQYARHSKAPRRLLYQREARRLQSYEAEVASIFDKVFVCTESERQAFDSSAPDLRVAVAPNGVDLDHFRRFELPRSKSPRLIFVGQMDHLPNVDGILDFARNVFPRLRRTIADLELLVVGHSPNSQVRALNALPGVVVTGSVGDVRPFLARAWAFVAPLRIESGVQNKVLEAMACELPVVCTPAVMAGLDDTAIRPGRDVLVGRTDQEFEQGIRALLKEPDLRSRMTSSARKQLRRAYSWELNLQSFEQALREIAEPAAAIALHPAQSMSA